MVSEQACVCSESGGGVSAGAADCASSQSAYYYRVWSKEKGENMQIEPWSKITQPGEVDNWALLWSDILTFSRSLKITKKSRSTHLKRYF